LGRFSTIDRWLIGVCVCVFAGRPRACPCPLHTYLPLGFVVMESGALVELVHALLSLTCAVAAPPTADTPACRFWNDTDQQWSSAGVLTIGLTHDAKGTVHLLCASSHLTAFMGSRGGGMSTHFALNVVHPIGDFGRLQVLGRRRRGGVSRWSAGCRPVMHPAVCWWGSVFCFACRPY
jgi:hypothetical protein